MKHSNIKDILEKQHYRVIGNHSAIKVCEWTKKSLIDKGVCFKEKFYGIKSHRCCQMTPWFDCQNRCLHCWRDIEITSGNKIKKNDSPEYIIGECIKTQRKLLLGFKGNKKINRKKYIESQEPMQFAISLIGEPTLYYNIGELIGKLKKLGKTSFLVTNGLQPDVLSELNKKRNLPTQLYLSLNAPNKEIYNGWHKSKDKDAWKKFNKTLKIFPKLRTRKVIRMTIVKSLNDNPKYIPEFVLLIKKAKPDFIEVKSFMSIGRARERLGYDRMLSFNEIKKYSLKLSKELKNGYRILDSHKLSRVILIGKSKNNMKIRKMKI